MPVTIETAGNPRRIQTNSMTKGISGLSSSSRNNKQTWEHWTSKKRAWTLLNYRIERQGFSFFSLHFFIVCLDFIGMEEEDFMAEDRQDIINRFKVSYVVVKDVFVEFYTVIGHYLVIIGNLCRQWWNSSSSVDWKGLGSRSGFTRLSGCNSIYLKACLMR